MDSNIIKAIINLVKKFDAEVKDSKDVHDRANSMGDGLEEYIKDLFIDSTTTNKSEKIQARSEIFSYTGSRNAPPDAILKAGDAIEVKKIETLKAPLALNSSYPKHKLYSNSSMISKSCKECEQWDEKDIVYCVGSLDKKTKKLNHLMMVYGEDYAASLDVYTGLKRKVTEAIKNADVDLSETNELARINKIDPLKITSLRIRGMWIIKNPVVVFDYIYNPKSNVDFQFAAIINFDKYETLKYTDDLEQLSKIESNLEIENVKIQDPNNPAKLRMAKLITFFK
jgi:hypothetical protein